MNSPTSNNIENLSEVKLLSTKEASEISGYHSDYIARLCRSGKISGKQVGKNWLVSHDSLLEFVKSQDARKKELSQQLSKEREQEYQKYMARAEGAIPRTVRKISPLFLKITTPADATIEEKLHKASAFQKSSQALLATLVVMLVCVYGCHAAMQSLSTAAQTLSLQNQQEPQLLAAALSSSSALPSSAYEMYADTGEFFYSGSTNFMSQYLAGIQARGAQSLAVGTFISDTGEHLPEILAYGAVNAIPAWVHLSQGIMHTYTSGIYAWVDVTPQVPGEFALAVYDIGSVVADTTANIPGVTVQGYQLAMNSYVNGTNDLGLSIIDHEIAFGNSAMNTTQSVLLAEQNAELPIRDGAIAFATEINSSNRLLASVQSSGNTYSFGQQVALATYFTLHNFFESSSSALATILSGNSASTSGNLTVEPNTLALGTPVTIGATSTQHIYPSQPNYGNDYASGNSYGNYHESSNNTSNNSASSNTTSNVFQTIVQGVSQSYVDQAIANLSSFLSSQNNSDHGSNGTAGGIITPAVGTDNISSNDSTFVNTIVTNATTTNATTTNSFITNSVVANATTTNDFATNFFATNDTFTNATSTNLFATLANITTGSISNLTSNLATIFGLTATNATTTNATSTNAFATNLTATNTTLANATSTNFYSSLATIASGTITNLNSTLGTITGLIATNATSTNLYSSNITTPSATIGALSLSNLNGFLTASSGSVTSTPTVNLANQVAGTLLVTNGGTGTSTGGVINGIDYYNGSNLTNNSGFVYSGGNVGIGTSSPSQTLSVQGNGYISGNLTVGNNFSVINGSVNIGSSTGNVAVSGTFNSNLVPSVNNTYNLGSPALFWNNLYANNIDVNTISAASSTIAGTQSSSFTINTANNTNDTEPMNLIFFRGMVNPNAVISWNPGVAQFQFNQPAFFDNQSSTSTIVTLAAQASPGQTADIFHALDSSGNVVLNATSNDLVGIGTSSPATALAVAGSTYLTGGLGVGALNTTPGSILATGNATVGSLVDNAVTANSLLYSNGTKQDSSVTLPSYLTLTSGSLAVSNLPNAQLQNSTISGVALGGNLANLSATNSTLTFSGSYNGSATQTIGLNLANPNTFSALQQFNGNASTTGLTVTGASNLASLTVSGASNLGILTATNASTTNFTASGYANVGSLIDNAVTANSLLYSNGTKQDSSVTVSSPLAFSAGTLSLGTVPVANGGTGSTTLSGILVGNGTNPINSLTVGTGLSLSGTTLSATGGTVGTGTIGQFPYYAANGTALTATSSLYLGTNGTLGIGTTTLLTYGGIPDSLDLNSNLRLTGSSYLILNSQATAAMSADNLGNLYEFTGTNGYYYFSVGGSYKATINSLGMSINNSSIGVSGSTGFVLGSGNAGFGTTTPSTALSVAGSGYFTGGLGVGALNTTAGTLLTTGTTTVGSLVDTGITANSLTYANGSNQLSSVTLPSYMTLTNGTLAISNLPNAQLQNSTISGVALGGNLANLSATNSTLTFSGSYNGGTAQTIGINLGNADTWSALQTFGAGFVSQASSTVTGAFNVGGQAYFGGNVGIGTTTPGSALSVAGSGYISGNLVASGNISTNGSINVAAGQAYNYNGQNVIIASTTLSDYFLGGAGSVSATGSFNTGLGAFALSGTSGSSNTAVGYNVLSSNTGSSNTAIGVSSLTFNGSGGNNVAIGNAALYNNSGGSSNIAIGTSAMSSNGGGGNNIALGGLALAGNGSGSYNIADGYQALDSNFGGSYNIATGYQALYTNLNGSNNTATGYQALYKNTASSNVAYGYQALYNNTSGTTNTAVGNNTLYYNTSATNDTVVGYNAGNGNGSTYSNQGGTYIGTSAGYSLQTGSDYNTFLGYQAGYGVTSGAGNILLGAASTTANANLTTGYGNIAIGNNISLPSATASGQLDIGNLIYGTGLNGTGSTLSTGNVGIGTTTPNSLLTVSGFSTAAKLNIADTAASGVATLQLSDASGDNYTIGRNSSTGFLNFNGTQSTYSGYNFQTSNGATNALTIINNGNVGIGTTNPQNVLTVNGYIESEGNSFVFNRYYSGGWKADTTGASGQITVFGANGGQMQFYVSPSETAGTSAVDGDPLTLFANSSAAIGSGYANIPGPSNGLIVQGNVGIGTTTPSSELYVGNAGSIGEDIGTNDGIFQTAITNHIVGNVGSIGIGINDGGGKTGVFVNNAHGYAGTPSIYNSQYITFNTDAGGIVASTERMRIDPFGNVGIGTTSPGSTLSVAGNAYVSGTLGVSSGINVTGQTNFYKDAPSGDQIYVHGLTNQNQELVLGYNTTSNYGTIAAQLAGSTPEPLVLNQSGGNVGIGTTTPGNTLDVNGGISTNGGNGSSQAMGPSLSMFDTGGIGYIQSVAANVTWEPLVEEANTFSWLSQSVFQGLYQNATGQVAIGTVSPSATLTIQPAAQNSTPLLNVVNVYNGASSLNTAFIHTDQTYLSGTNTGTYTGAALEVTTFPSTFSGNTGDVLKLGTSDSSGNSFASYMEVKAATGYVGLGTASPIDQLTVTGAGTTTANIVTGSGAASMGGTLALEDTGQAPGAGGGIIFGAGGGNWNFASIKGAVGDGSGNSRGDLVFSTRTNVNNSTLTEAMRLTNTGNLNIGTANSLGSTVTLAGNQYIYPVTDFTTAASANQLAIGEASANSAYQLRLGYFYSGTAWIGVMQSVQNNTGGPLLINPSGGNVGINGLSTLSTMTVNGSFCVSNQGNGGSSCGSTSGQAYAHAFNTGSYDVAENYPASNSAATVPGTIVALDPSGNESITTASAGASGGSGASGASAEAILGVVSTNPGLVLGGADASTTNQLKAPVALSGRVPVSVSMEGGPISVGDRIALSSTPGVGMKATQSGETVGIALQSASAAGKIDVFVQPQYYFDPGELSLTAAANTVSIGGSGTGGGINGASGASAGANASSATNLAVSGNISSTNITASGAGTFTGALSAASVSAPIFEESGAGSTFSQTFSGLSIAGTPATSVLTTDGTGVDIYKLAYLDTTGVQMLTTQMSSLISQTVQIASTTNALSSTTSSLSSQLLSMNARVSALEAGAAAASASADVASSTTGTDFLTATSSALASAMQSFGILLQNGVAQFDTLVARDLVFSKDSNGSSAAGSGEVLAGNTTVQILNAHMLASSDVSVTLTSPMTGSWYVTNKQDGSFQLTFSAAQPNIVTFDYFIVQTQGQIATSTPDTTGNPFSWLANFLGGSSSSTNTSNSNTSVSGDSSAGAESGSGAGIGTSGSGESGTGSGSSTNGSAGATSSSANPNAPKVTLNGAAAIAVLQGSLFTDPGATAVDASGTDITSSIVETGTVDTNTVGLYTLTYTATDSQGNSANVSRVVSVTSVVSSAPSSGGGGGSSSGTTGGSTSSSGGGSSSGSGSGTTSSSGSSSGSGSTSTSGGSTGASGTSAGGNTSGSSSGTSSSSGSGGTSSGSAASGSGTGSSSAGTSSGSSTGTSSGTSSGTTSSTGSTSGSSSDTSSSGSASVSSGTSGSTSASSDSSSGSGS